MMLPDEYLKLAERTELDQRISAARFSANNPLSVRLNHAVIGMMGEVGELAAAVEKWLYYGRDLDLVNVREEIGDLEWYIAEACNALGFSLEEILSGNIAKLKARYPDKYTDAAAREENRDRDKEREAMESSIPPVPTGPACEICRSPARVQVHDSTRDGEYRETHHYCRKHRRPAAILQRPLPHETKE